MSRRCRVLLVDDEPRVRQATARLLALEFELAEAGSVAEALTVLGTFAPDVLVTDLDLGEGVPGGEVLLAHLRDRHPAVVRVILSGSSTRAKEALASGLAGRVIHKAEVSAAQLVESVRACCSPDGN